MKYDLFIEMVRENVESKMGKDFKVTVEKIVKNNGLILTGLVIRTEDRNISPTIYLEGYYEKYQDGRYTIHSIANDIIDVYKSNEVSEDYDIKFFMDYERISPYIIHKLINYEKNEELLKDTPHVKFLDMAIIFQVLVAHDQKLDGTATITIKQSHCKVWEIGLDDLVFTARRNTPRLMPYTFVSMAEAIEGMITEEGFDEELPGLSLPMYVASNEQKMHGANAIIDKNFLRECSDRMEDSYYILPSSIHETIMIPKKYGDYTDGLQEMVQSINSEVVRQEEVLSDSVYFYDRENDKLSVL